MTPFELAVPRSLREAVALLDPDDPSVRAIAGGTALVNMMKVGVFQPTRLVSLRSVEPECSPIALDDDGALHIGALTSLAAVEYSSMVRDFAPVITRTLRTLSNVRTRNVATIGGHLAHADPHMDLPPVLIALSARVRVVGPAREREIAVEELFAGYYETTLARDELIAELIIPPQKGRRAAYQKCTTRSADDWPALGVAAAVDASDGTIREARIVVSAATPKATRLRRAEAILLEGAADSVLRRAAEAAAQEADVIADHHGSAAYKRQLVRVHVERAVRNALAAAYGTRVMKAAHTETSQVGRSTPRLEAREKVSGRAEYIHNLRLPGMLYGKVFRSTLAHGRLKSIDVAAAAAVKGVHRVVTGEDVKRVISNPYDGPIFHDQPILAIDKVHHVGQAVAVVLAADPHVAEAGRATDRRRVRGTACGVRRSGGDEANVARGARGAQACWHVPGFQGPRRPPRHEPASALQTAPRRRAGRFCQRRSHLRAHVQHDADHAHDASSRS